MRVSTKLWRLSQSMAASMSLGLTASLDSPYSVHLFNGTRARDKGLIPYVP